MLPERCRIDARLSAYYLCWGLDSMRFENRLGSGLSGPTFFVCEFRAGFDRHGPGEETMVTRISIRSCT